MLTIRNETAADIAAIHALQHAAFGQDAEARLVDMLREAGALRYSLVAVQDDRIVGHLAISPVSIIDGAVTSHALGLAPMAVLPDYQQQGIGTQLLRYWQQELANADDNLLVVLGHADYYPRFGFVCAEPFGIRCEYEVPAENFMVLELKPGALQKISGLVEYHRAFASL